MLVLRKTDLLTEPNNYFIFNNSPVISKRFKKIYILILMFNNIYNVPAFL